MLEWFILLIHKFCVEFKKHDIPLNEAIGLCEHFCWCHSVPFPFTPSSMDDLFNVMKKLPCNNCFNLRLLHILAEADGFNIPCLKISLQNYIRAYSSLKISKAISNMPGVFQNVQILDGLTVGCMINDNADTAATFDNNTWKFNCVSKKQEVVRLEIKLCSNTLYLRVGNDKVELEVEFHNSSIGKAVVFDSYFLIYICIYVRIKTHSSESQGQEEAGLHNE